MNKIVMLTNHTVEAKRIVNAIENKISIDKIFIEMKTNNQIEIVIRKIIGTNIFYILKQMWGTIGDKTKRAIFAAEFVHRVNLLRKLGVKRIRAKCEYIRFVSEPYVIKEIAEIKPEWIIVFGTGIIREPLLSMPQKGIINIHLSMLPYYKGAMSEFWQDRDGDYDKIGVTIHEIDAGVDTGRIFVQRHTLRTPDDNFITLRYKNIVTASQLISDSIVDIIEGKIVPYRQNENVKSLYSIKMLTDDIRKEYWGKR